ncbi:Stf0 family sulfotransferase [Methylobacterium thuringiense]|uniref:Trehalose 2-sulfotransferase n=2 Tax=Methylobacterium TaxID=407 RepID=A0ABQ4TEI1_9HYPH|nr:Stf0 family sulfotransferase [Methylobacterium thuringiense]GJE53788.1 Trehalose 2-sulfotransferase [Methylobacterium thuringiense]
MALIVELLGRLRRKAARPPSDRPLPRGYAVCGAPRSGSNYFCEILSSTGRLGHPREYFNANARRAIDDPNFPDDPHLQIERILTSGATQNGIYALKLFPGLFDTVSQHLKLTQALPNLHFVRLRRRDLLGQAISWARSTQTQQFRSTQTPSGEGRYDADLTRAYLAQACQRSARWDMYFARTGIDPVEVTYEELSSDPQGAVDKVADALNVARPRVALDRVRLEVQRDELSGEWRRRFIAEHGDPSHIDPVEAMAATL